MKQLAAVIKTNSPVSALHCPGFETLNDQEKLYAYHFARASWEGARICYFQRSYESPGLFYIFHKIFNYEEPYAVSSRLISQNWSNEEVQQLFVYVAAVFQNCGNFKCFGHTKFIPEISQQKFEYFVTNSPGYDVDEVWEKIKKYIYNIDKPYKLIDLQEKGGSNAYYSPELTHGQIEQVDKLLMENNISELNTRIIKVGNEIHVLIASINEQIKELSAIGDLQVKLIYGDYSPFLKSIVNHLTNALKYATNENQILMIKSYINHFQSGDVEQHKESQRHWIKDKGPVIETNIGFIETYLDPLKLRAEYEGFVAVVNKEQSQLLSVLVENAEKIIKYLPWPKEYEIEVYKRPDFTSLEVLAFAASGLFLGISLPNYDDIRQTAGFKNVNLGNAIGKYQKEFILFLEDDHQELFYKYQSQAIFLMVSLHELIGHGAGKIFMQDETGKFNFDIENTINPLTNEKVKTFYKFGENWHSKFGEFSGAMEECKADATALYLSTFEDVVQLLLPSYTKEERQKIVIAGWLFIIYRGIIGLEFYDSELQKWGQAHVLARNVILQALIKEDPQIIQIKETTKHDQSYFVVKFDSSRIQTTGKQTIQNLILHLQVFKSTGANKEGLDFFKKLAMINDQFLRIRDIVIRNRTPRQLDLQPELTLINGNVTINYFEQTFSGIIKSQVSNHQENIEETKEMFLKVQSHFQN